MGETPEKAIKQDHIEQGMKLPVKILFVDTPDPFSEIEHRLQPLWPAYLATYARQHFDPQSVQFAFSSSDLETDLAAFQPHIVGLSAVSQNYARAMQYARIAKSKGISVIMGGIHISVLPQCLTADMDVGCLGEGEITFVELIKSFMQHGGFVSEALAAIEGITYRQQGRLVITPPRPLCAALDQLGHPDRALVGYRKCDYMLTSRGCPYRCAFCATSRYWDKVRFHSTDYVITQIRELVEHGAKIITFYDDLFIADKKRCLEISDGVQAMGLPRNIAFRCSCRANLITTEIVAALKAMNVRSVWLGLESGCERVLQYLKGSVTVEDNHRAVILLKNAGIETNAAFVIGSPDETEAEMMQTYAFIKQHRLDLIVVFVLTPLPGTPIWDYALKRKLVSNSMDWNLLNVNFQTQSERGIILSEVLTRAQFLRIYKRFRRLRLLYILKALPSSALIPDFLEISIGKFKEQVARIMRSSPKPGLPAS